MTDLETDSTSTPPGESTRNADDMLPPVQPPAASFIMQLFLIPLLIVSVIVGVWMLVSWVANMGTQPTELVNDIEHLNHASWQKALTLANTLRDPRFEHLREDPALAARVSTLLDNQLAGDQTDRDNLWLQIYLCRVLGEFNIDDGMPTLLKAIQRTDPPEVTEVRRSALQALGLLVDRIGSKQALTNAELIPVLISASQTSAAAPASGDGPAVSDARPHRIRSTAAFVLGLLESQQAKDQLVTLLDDPNTDVRYNAATGLARQSDSRAAPMLKPDEASLAVDMDESLAEPEKQKWLLWKRDLIVANALRSIEKLANDQTTLESAGLIEGLTEVAAGGLVSEAVRIEANKLLKQLQPAATSP